MEFFKVLRDGHIESKYIIRNELRLYQKTKTG